MRDDAPYSKLSWIGLQNISDAASFTSEKFRKTTLMKPEMN
jgi:hypothetical protein